MAKVDKIQKLNSLGIRVRQIKAEQNNGQVMTEPDQSFTIPQLVKRMQQGWQPAKEYQAVYDELADLTSFDLSKASRLDPTELTEMLEVLNVEIAQAKAKADELLAKTNAKIAEDEKPETDPETDGGTV